MEEIRAFVGHSFAQEDAEVIGHFLKYFTQLSQLVPRFSWEHAEVAEPKVIAEKVMSIIANKNVFIGICTKKEYVIQPSSLRKSRFNSYKIYIKDNTYRWKTSDWIIQEIGLARGLNLNIILLLEDGVQNPGGLQSDLEYIKFDRTAPERSFGKINEMISALSPKIPNEEAIAANPKSALDAEQNNLGLPKEDDDLRNPTLEWTRDQYEHAFFYMTIIRRYFRNSQISLMI